MAQPFVFGPKVLGKKNQRYSLQILTRGKELDPPAEARGQDDVSIRPQQFEIRDMLCPNDANVTYKFKQLFVDPNNLAELGEVEYNIQVDLDP